MAITKEVFIEGVIVRVDGQVEVVTRTQYFDEGFVVTSRKDTHPIDVGDDVTREDDLVKDVVNGNLHNQTRIDARDAARQAEEDKLSPPVDP